MILSTFDSYLLHTTGKAFGLVRLQTDDTLILGNSKFATVKKNLPHEAKFLARERENLAPFILLQLSGGLNTLIENAIYLSQEKQC